MKEKFEAPAIEVMQIDNLCGIMASGENLAESNSVSYAKDTEATQAYDKWLGKNIGF